MRRAAPLALLIACAGGPGGSADSAAPAPLRFTLEDQHGATVTQDDLAGRVVQLALVAAWCYACARDAPDWQEAVAPLGDEVALVMVVMESIHGTEPTRDDAADWADAVGATGLVLAGPGGLEDLLGDAYPTMPVLDAEGAMVVTDNHPLDPSLLADLAAE